MKKLIYTIEARLIASIQHNHEAWHCCSVCGKWFDRRLHGDNCPDCGTNVNAMP